MTDATTTDKPLSVLERAQQLTLEEIWSALPERVQANPGCMKRLHDAGPKLGAATYKDYFWKPDPDGRGMVHSLPDDKLLALMIGLYIHKGGNDPQGELQFWQSIFGC